MSQAFRNIGDFSHSEIIEASHSVGLDMVQDELIVGAIQPETVSLLASGEPTFNYDQDDFSNQRFKAIQKNHGLLAQIYDGSKTRELHIGLGLRAAQKKGTVR